MREGEVICRAEFIRGRFQGRCSGTSRSASTTLLKAIVIFAGCDGDGYVFLRLVVMKYKEIIRN